MSTFQEKLDEFYLNYDTATLLKEDVETTEIVQMFKDELEYPEDLTTALLTFNKSYLKSVVMRIKVRQAKLSNAELKSDLLKYNKELAPILDKLLSEKFKQQYNQVVETKTKVVEQQVEKQVVKEEQVVQDEDDDEEVETENVIEEDEEDEEISNEDLIKQYLDQKVVENSSSELKLVEIFESFNNYCSENDYEYIKASTFKKLLRAEWGKAEGKGEKSVYKGYQFC
jgi:hypothetical protein